MADPPPRRDLVIDCYGSFVRAARVVRHSSLLGAITASLFACVAGPQPEPPGDPSEAGVAAARDSGRAPPDVGSSAPPPAPPPEPDAGADGLDEGGVTPVPMDGATGEADAGVPPASDAGPAMDAGHDGDAHVGVDAGDDGGSGELDSGGVETDAATAFDAGDGALDDGGASDADWLDDDAGD